jgi:predicted peptidase
MKQKQNKPNTALQTEKEGKTTTKQEKWQEGAENGLKNNSINMEGVENFQQPIQTPNYKEQLAELTGQKGLETDTMPEGLTPIQQAVWKNNQKMKAKKTVVTTFGAGKTEKKSEDPF